MSENKVKKGKKHEKPAETQLVITVTKGEVIKVEMLGATGQHRELSEKEFAAFAGEDELTDLEDALEEAYAAGVNDAVEDFIESDFAADEDEEIRHTIIRETAARQLLRRGVRRLILRRALQRGPKRTKARSNGNGVREATKH